jgi:hypothetical protein
MSIERLNNMYGEGWHINAPPNAEPIVLEGFRDVTTPAQDGPIVVCNHTLEESIVLVIHRLFAQYFDIEEQTGEITELHPACQVGRLSWSPRISKRIEGTLATDFKNQDGFVGAPANKRSETGLSWAGYVNIERSPIIVETGKSFDIIVNIIDEAAGQPIPEGTRRSFYAKATGFTLISP